MKKSDYNKAKNILKRYSYNSIEITKKGIDILEDEHEEELQNCINEYKVVKKALKLAHKDCEDILQKYYVKRMSKWEICEEGMSERTFERRLQDLIYNVAKEYKKMLKKIQKVSRPLQE
jgi:hypothetical protein